MRNVGPHGVFRLPGRSFCPAPRVHRYPESSAADPLTPSPITELTSTSAGEPFACDDGILDGDICCAVRGITMMMLGFDGVNLHGQPHENAFDTILVLISTTSCGSAQKVRPRTNTSCVCLQPCLHRTDAEHAAEAVAETEETDYPRPVRVPSYYPL